MLVYHPHLHSEDIQSTRKTHPCTQNSRCCFPNNVAKYQIPVARPYQIIHIIKMASAEKKPSFKIAAPSRGRNQKKMFQNENNSAINAYLLLPLGKTPGEVATTRIGLFWMMPVMSMAKSMIGRKHELNSLREVPQL